MQHLTVVDKRRDTSNESTASHHLKASLLHQEQSYVKWYGSHQSNLHTVAGRIHTEEPETEHILEDLPLKSRSCLRCCDCDPYLKCYRDLQKIRKYRHKIQTIFENVYGNLRWVDMPGGQHAMAADKNYLVHYIWLITSLTNEVDGTNKDTARHIRYRLEDILAQAESLGILLQKFFKPMIALTEKQAVIEDIGQLVHVKTKRKFKWLTSERKIIRLTIRPDSTLLSDRGMHGDKDKNKLIIYVRRDTQVWARFPALVEADKVDVVTKGLMEISDCIKELRTVMKKPLRALKAARKWGSLHPSNLFRTNLIPHVERMRNRIKKIVHRDKDKQRPAGMEEEEEKDHKVLEALLEETANHYEYILRYGELLVEELWDIILMARLSYTYVKDSTTNSILMASYDAVLQSKFSAGERKKLLRPSHFAMDDFFKTDCPQTLRKVPIIVASINAEICLHLHGHKNSHKSAVSTAPSSRFTKKRTLNSAGSGSSEDGMEYVDGQKRKTLVFVSEGGG